jgi:alpha-tubulin suppressor-like RCC1 family protein
VSLASGNANSFCAVLRSGSVECWGDNDNGALGNGSDRSSDVPAAVKDLTGVIGLAGGYDGYCAALHSGSAECWGNNFAGALGNGNENEPQSTVPVAVHAAAGVTSVAAGYGSYCSVIGSGHVWCWGDNSYGPQNTSAALHSNIPVEVTGLDDATNVVMSNGSYCAILHSGGVDCWGGNFDGDLGAGAVVSFSTVAQAVKDLG